MPQNASKREIAKSASPDIASVFDRPVPTDLDAEMALLGSCLQDAAMIPVAVEVLTGAGEDAFSRDSHRLLFRAMKTLVDRAAPIDSVLIRDELQRESKFEAVGGYEYMAKLINAVPHSLRARHYATQVRKAWVRREMIRHSYRLLEEAYDRAVDVSDLLGSWGKALDEIGQAAVTDKPADLSAEVATELARARSGQAMPAVATGWVEVDHMLGGGFHDGELVIVAGRPGMGKTAFLMSVAAQLRDAPALFFSLEMGPPEITRRLLCAVGSVDLSRLIRGRLDDAELAWLERADAVVRRLPLLLHCSSRLTIDELAARMRTARRQRRIGLAIVDYAQLIRAPGEKDLRLEMVRISATLKELARELGIPILVAAQLNRAGETGVVKVRRPRLSDLKESGSFEQDADVVILLHRPAYYAEAESTESPTVPFDLAEALIAKQRNGPTGLCKLRFQAKFTRFDPWHVPAEDAARMPINQEQPW